MSDTAAAIPRPDEHQAWEAARRIESWAGEIRLNRLRLAAIIIFYVRHLIDIYLNPQNRQFSNRYHLLVTAIVLVWMAQVLWLHWALSQRRIGFRLSYITVVWDLAMVTLLGLLGGPRSPLLLLYFIVIASAPLRLSLRIVWTATLGAMLGYAIVLMYYAWYVVGWSKYYATPELQIPRSVEFIWLLALAVAGLLAGQVVRQMRRISIGHAIAIDDVPSETKTEG